MDNILWPDAPHADLSLASIPGIRRLRVGSEEGSSSWLLVCCRQITPPDSGRAVATCSS
jgi:hypothetical protein